MDGTRAIKWQQQQSVREGKVFNRTPDLFLGQDSRSLFAGATMMFLICNKFHTVGGCFLIWYCFMGNLDW
jgi:hypothetical protein